MTPTFAETSFYVAITNPRDSLHSRAQSIAARLIDPIVTTDYVLFEVASFLCRGVQARTVFRELWLDLHNSPGIEVIPASPQLKNRALTLFFSRPDKDWSLTDCTSFVVMSERKMIEALTADHHFEQAGFRGLLIQT